MILNALSQYEHEHQSNIASIRQITRADLTVLYSKSVAFLFEFIKFNVILYLVLSCLSLISWIPQLIHLLQVSQNLNGANKLIHLFFVSGFPPKSAQFLWIQWILTFVWFQLAQTFYSVLFCESSPFAWFWIRHAQTWLGIQEFFEQEDPREAFYATEDSPDGLNRIRLPTTNIRLKKGYLLLASVFLFVLTLCVYAILQGLVQYWILKNYARSLGMSFLAGVLHTIMKASWRRVSWILTRYEKHPYWDAFYTSYFIKAYLFDVLSFCLFYLSRILALLYLDPDLHFLKDVCQLDWLAEQFLWVLVLDYVGYRLGECMVAEMQNLICVFGGRSLNLDRSDESLRYKFTVVEEYVKLCVRQYYVLGGTLVMPAISWIGLILGVLDYWRCLYKLVWLCGRPRASKESYVKVVWLAGWGNMVFSLLSYPGLVWLFVLGIDAYGCGANIFH